MRDNEHVLRMIDLYKKAYEEHGMPQSVIDKAFIDRIEYEAKLIFDERIEQLDYVPNKIQLKEINNSINRNDIMLTDEEILEIYESLWNYDEYRPVDKIKHS